MAWTTIQYDREKLYQEVWTEPMTAVAARYGVSSAALATVCRKLAVPRPGRGYWALMAAGRPPAKPGLPAVKPGQPTTVTSERWRPESEQERRIREEEIEGRRLEQQKLDDLASRVLDHVQAEEIRGFLRAVEAYAAVNGSVGPEPEVTAWMDWARGVAISLQEKAIRTLLVYRPPPAR
ncbi:MAG TPA: hypothetical protein VHO06_17125 [Polyangia bacterium]|nr:hypothetical protein [Polyangia bacterium]